LVEDGCFVDQVQVGESHMTVLTTEGEVLTTGAGSYGRLGNFDTVDQLYLEPVELLTSASGVIQIAGGKSFTLALTNDGVVYGWGRNHKGQLGTGLGLAVDMYAMQAVPEPIEADELLGRKVTKIAAGHSHAACVRKLPSQNCCEIFDHVSQCHFLFVLTHHVVYRSLLEESFSSGVLRNILSLTVLLTSSTHKL